MARQAVTARSHHRAAARCCAAHRLSVMLQASAFRQVAHGCVVERELLDILCARLPPRSLPPDLIQWTKRPMCSMSCSTTAVSSQSPSTPAPPPITCSRSARSYRASSCRRARPSTPQCRLTKVIGHNRSSSRRPDSPAGLSRNYAADGLCSHRPCQ